MLRSQRSVEAENLLLRRQLALYNMTLPELAAFTGTTLPMTWFLTRDACGMVKGQILAPRLD